MSKILKSHKVQKFSDGWAVTFFNPATGRRVKSAFCEYKTKAEADNALETLEWEAKQRVKRLFPFKRRE